MSECDFTIDSRSVDDQSLYLPPRPDLKAIDLYSGIGGWALGLNLAGISLVASYERSKSACETQRNNQGGQVFQCDIRNEALDIPPGIDIVVGSPPCTEFSLSNRGGAGDIENGLKDLDSFLTVVNDIKPRYWILENVPRVKSILYSHVFGSKGKLKRFRPLFDANDVHIRLFDMSQFGLPQKRLRCIAGRYPAELLDAYAKRCAPIVLRDVIAGLNSDVIVDPIYGVELSRNDLTEHDLEPPLTPEELRLNRDSKRHHPIYNRMSFPDRMDRPVRSITATCTRVSRESVVINSMNARSFRRLTLRERASLQGFPITYQFYADSYSRKMEMIGNAIPPLFVYYLGRALKRVEPKAVVPPKQVQFQHTVPLIAAPLTRPPVNRTRYPARRRFRATIPALRFKSGVRFELSNEFTNSSVYWRVRFLFGNSKDIRILCPQYHHHQKLERFLRRHALLEAVRRHRDVVLGSAATLDASILQQTWIHLRKGDGPHAIVGALARMTRAVANDLKAIDDCLVQRCLASTMSLGVPPLPNSQGGGPINQKKFKKNAVALLAGLIATSWFNSAVDIRSNRLCPLP